MKNVVDPEKLESSFVELMEAVDQLREGKELLGGKLKQGIFNLSRARYSMGASKLGFQQYEGRSMAAAARVLVHVPNMQDTPLSQPSGPGQQMYVLMNEPEGGLPAGRALSSAADDGLRKRLTPIDASIGGAHADKPATVKSNVPSSPMTWFNGGMVPPALKEAQRDFRAVVDLAIQVANTSHAVNLALSRWQKLSGSEFIDGDCSDVCLAEEKHSMLGSTTTKVPKKHLTRSEKDGRTRARIRVSAHGHAASDSEEEEEEEWRVHQSKGGEADGTTSAAAQESPQVASVGLAQRVPKKHLTRKENDARVRARVKKTHDDDSSDSEDEDWQVCDHEGAPKVMEPEEGSVSSSDVSRVPKKQLTRKEQDGKLRARARARAHGHEVSDSEDEEWQMSTSGKNADPPSTAKLGEASTDCTSVNSDGTKVPRKQLTRHEKQNRVRRTHVAEGCADNVSESDDEEWE